MYPGRNEGQLRAYFTGLAEQTFEAQLGVADVALVDYIVDLLVRFVRSDAVFSLRGLSGKPLRELAEMVCEAELRQGEARRQTHRQIGDFTLFWTGVYPEALPHLQGRGAMARMLDYSSVGKRSYRIASSIDADDRADESELLARLSHEFELCQYGLGEVRREWERREDGPKSGLWIQ